MFKMLSIGRQSHIQTKNSVPWLPDDLVKPEIRVSTAMTLTYFYEIFWSHHGTVCVKQSYWCINPSELLINIGSGIAFFTTCWKLSRDNSSGNDELKPLWDEDFPCGPSNITQLILNWGNQVRGACHRNIEYQLWELARKRQHQGLNLDHCSRNITILTKFSSMAALEGVKMTPSSAANEENFVKMTFPFKWWSLSIGKAHDMIKCGSITSWPAFPLIPVIDIYNSSIMAGYAVTLVNTKLVYFLHCHWHAICNSPLHCRCYAWCNILLQLIVSQWDSSVLDKTRCMYICSFASLWRSYEMSFWLQSMKS